MRVPSRKNVSSKAARHLRYLVGARNRIDHIVIRSWRTVECSQCPSFTEIDC